MPLLEVVAHRVAWGLLSVALWVSVRGRWREALAVASRPRTVLVLAGTAVLIAVNWLVFIWLSTVGLIQYISPSCQFLVAVLLFREPFAAAHAATFACIWVALALLGWDLRRGLAAASATAAALAEAPPCAVGRDRGGANGRPASCRAGAGTPPGGREAGRRCGGPGA
ncbi:MAG: hypothetical protein V1750_11660 [Acidobacteriota bacterium]